MFFHVLSALKGQVLKKFGKGQCEEIALWPIFLEENVSQDLEPLKTHDSNEYIDLYITSIFDSLTLLDTQNLALYLKARRCEQLAAQTSMLPPPAYTPGHGVSI